MVKSLRLKLSIENLSVASDDIGLLWEVRRTLSNRSGQTSRCHAVSTDWLKQHRSFSQNMLPQRFRSIGNLWGGVSHSGVSMVTVSLLNRTGRHLSVSIDRLAAVALGIRLCYSLDPRMHAATFSAMTIRGTVFAETFENRWLRH